VSHHRALFVVTTLASALAFGAFAPAAETYTVDPAHTWVAYRVKHMDLASSYGQFKDVSGSFTIDEAAPEKSTFAFTVKVASIDSANPKRDEHLLSTDFFNAKQFPTISFKSTKVVKVPAGGYEVMGVMSLHGVEKPVSFKVAAVPQVKGPQGGYVAGFDADLKIKRSEFGMTNGIPMIGDDVTLMIGIEGKRK
jgi:polyisoprenoid-binding protein YceI